MDPYATSHFSSTALRRDLKAQVAHDCRSTAVLLSRIGEFDERKLYLEDAHPSMYSYCLHELCFCEGTAARRIYAARAARRFPVLFDAVADGRLHLSAVVMLSRYLTSGNVDDLVAEATHRSKAEIELLIANRFPRRDLPERLEAVSPPQAMTGPPGAQHSPENVHAGDILATPWSAQHSPENAVAPVLPETLPATVPVGQHSPENVHAGDILATPWSARHSPENAAAAGPWASVKPLAPQRFGFQLTVDQETHDLWQYVRSLMSHEIPTGELARVFKNVLKLAAAELEKRKFAATTRSGPSRPGTSPRHIPAPVKRAVWERDGGQCTFESDTGKRCPSRRLLEFDHVDPVALGGESTVENLRLRCRPHNRQAAERAFGAEFIARKLSAARRAAPE
jgi:mannose-6-phosphate isomerase-like protein (cupin superfamily)